MCAASPAAVDVVLGLLDADEGVSQAHASSLEAEASLRWRTDPVDMARRFAERTGHGAREGQRSGASE